MKRHVLVGRFGRNDTGTVPLAPGEAMTPLRFVESNRHLGFGIGTALDDLAQLSIHPTELGLDLLVTAAHVQAADTRICRHTESQDSWTREIRLIVPVSDPGKWNRVALLVKRMLDFLTGDKWTLGFRSRPKGFERLAPDEPLQLLAARFANPALFSGGLDSLIGAIDSMESGQTPLFISHWGDGATSKAQHELFEGLTRHYKDRSPARLRAGMSFPNGLVRNVGPEMSTRGRSFLFIALGAFAGTGLRRPFTLGVPENGLIALNVPLDPLRLGALSTRTTHPFYLARWNDLLAQLEIPGRVENPYWDKTKGEMISSCKNRRLLTKLLPESLSCSSPAKGRWKKRPSIEHCGFCIPCLIRRAAIKHGLGKNDPTHYTLSDLTEHVLNTAKAEGEQVRSVQYAIERIRGNPAIARFLIAKPGPLSDASPSEQAALADVYRRGLFELDALLKRAQTKAS